VSVLHTSERRALECGCVTYRFAIFTLDGDTRQLLAAGCEIHLSPKAFDLLLLLVANHSRALSKAELQELLWPSTFVGETNLATLVAEIRRALGDSAHGSKYVRTVHRFGYRFVAPAADVWKTQDGPEGGPRIYLKTADRQFRLAFGATIVGRAQDAAVRIEAGGVSRHHARIVVAADGAHVEDLGSKNGTFVDGEPVAHAC
jgi:DNA-binding winged helix-turn-helix (wHTH) protein